MDELLPPLFRHRTVARVCSRGVSNPRCVPLHVRVVAVGRRVPNKQDRLVCSVADLRVCLLMPRRIFFDFLTSCRHCWCHRATNEHTCVVVHACVLMSAQMGPRRPVCVVNTRVAQVGSRAPARNHTTVRRTSLIKRKYIIVSSIGAQACARQSGLHRSDLHSHSTSPAVTAVRHLVHRTNTNPNHNPDVIILYP